MDEDFLQNSEPLRVLWVSKVTIRKVIPEMRRKRGLVFLTKITSNNQFTRRLF